MTLSHLPCRLSNAYAAASVFLMGALMPNLAGAQEAPNSAQDGNIGLLPAGSALAEEVHFFHNGILMPIITVISLFVLALLIYVVFRFNSKANPQPSKFSHNTLIEIIWTGVPILILLVIALPSFELLYKEDVIPDGKQVIAQADGRTTEFVFANDFASESRRVTRPDHLQVFVSNGDETAKLSRGDYKVSNLGQAEVLVALNSAPAAGSRVIMRGGRSLVGRGDRKEIAMAPTMTLKVSGYQWGWSYSYPDFGDFEFASNMLPASETSKELYRLAVDNPIYVPVGETIRVTTTARDVIHSFSMPNFALKVDAVPGRINETWFKADRAETFYGYCQEICGINHSFMPIEVRAVPRDEFEAWVDSQRALAGMDPMFNTDTDDARFAQNQ
ncbi:MAG: cytochrome c oxidase subunit II [Pseudomonadota bacterium]